AEQVHQLCATCHAYPPPDTFPRRAWRQELKQAYNFFHDSALRFDYPGLESVARYYEARAPEELPPPPREPHVGGGPVRASAPSYGPPGRAGIPGVTNVNLVDLFGGRGRDVLVCDAHRDEVLAFLAYESPPRWQVLGKARAPAHAEVVDLDGDGRK